MARKSSLTVHDEKLLTLASNGKSAEEIAVVIGVSPERAILRIREILSSRDVWDDIEREKLLLHSLYQLKGRLEDNMDSLIGDSKALEGYRRTLDLLGQTLERRSRVNDTDMDRVTVAQAAVLGRIVGQAYGSAKRRLEEKYGDVVDIGEIDQLFQDGMREAALQIEQERVDN